MQILLDIYEVITTILKRLRAHLFKPLTIKQLNAKGVHVQIEEFTKEKYKDLKFTKMFAKYIVSLDELPFYTGQFVHMLTDAELNELRKILCMEEFYKNEDVMTLVLCLACAEEGDWDLDNVDEIDCELHATMAGALYNVVFLECMERLDLVNVLEELSINPKSTVRYKVTKHGEHIGSFLNNKV